MKSKVLIDITDRMNSKFFTALVIPSLSGEKTAARESGNSSVAKTVMSGSPMLGDAAAEWSAARAAMEAAGRFPIAATDADVVRTNSLREEPTQYPELV